MSKVNEKDTASEAKVEASKTNEVVESPCYVFIDNTLIWGVLYKKGNCIELNESDMELFGPYVKLCDKTNPVDNSECKQC